MICEQKEKEKKEKTKNLTTKEETSQKDRRALFKNINLSSQISTLQKMASDIRVLDMHLSGLSGLKPIKEKSPLSGLTLSFRMPEKDVKNLATFLEELAKIVGILTAGGFSNLALEGKGIDIEKWLDNIHQFIAPWRANRNDWVTDFFGHPVLGYAMASYFRQQGFNRIVSFIGTVLADIFWEYACEGPIAGVEWNDLLTTGLIGNLAGVLIQSASVGPIKVKPTPFVIPGQKD